MRTRGPSRRFGALQGVSVLDLSKGLAGPVCAQSLGDPGAVVIKVAPVGPGGRYAFCGFGRRRGICNMIALPCFRSGLRVCRERRGIVSTDAQATTAGVMRDVPAQL